MLSGPHQKFAEGIAGGLNATQAYLTAYPTASPENAAKNTTRLTKNDEITAEVERLREAAKQKAGGAVLTLAEKLDLLAGIARSRPDDAAADNPLCELRMSKQGPFYTFPDKLRAIEMHAKLSGELSDKVQVSGEVKIHVIIGG